MTNKAGGWGYVPAGGSGRVSSGGGSSLDPKVPWSEAAYRMEAEEAAKLGVVQATDLPGGNGQLSVVYGGICGGQGGIRNASGGNGGTGFAYLIDPNLEPETRDIMRAMGGRQPTTSEWAYLFDKSWRGGAMDPDIVEKMRMAHNLAIAGFRRP
ncbi:hypothetical protein [Hyphomicrobium sp. ghe19]|uniref:hypothetical protein n=1 Tax=Hyphomicrobium sp. ghe19 TaxID=2682968 RepID=UPI001366E992|nr:hypothetical protein HYPP_01539 [Hyphomicrobium sp. ghe19]